MPSVDRERLIAFAATFLIVIGFLRLYAYLAPLWKHEITPGAWAPGDFIYFYQLGKCVLNGTNPYSKFFVHYFPAAVASFSLFALSDLTAGYRTMLTLLIASFVTLCCIVWIMTNRSALGFLFIGILMNSMPYFSDFFMGNLHTPVALLILLAFWLILKDRHVLAGVALGLAALMKFSPLLLIALFAWKKRFRTCLTAVSLITAGFIPVALFTPNLLSGFADTAYAIISGWPWWVSEGTYLMFVPVELHRIAHSIFSACVLLVTLYAITDRSLDVVQYCVMVTAMTLMLPMLWRYYLTWVIPVALLTLTTDAFRGKRAFIALGVIASFSYGWIRALFPGLLTLWTLSVASCIERRL